MPLHRYNGRHTHHFPYTLSCHEPCPALSLSYIHIVYGGKYRHNDSENDCLYQASGNLLHNKEGNNEGNKAEYIISKVFHIQAFYLIII